MTHDFSAVSIKAEVNDDNGHIRAPTIQSSLPEGGLKNNWMDFGLGWNWFGLGGI